jgi:hypothetical protein
MRMQGMKQMTIESNGARMNQLEEDYIYELQERKGLSSG